MDYGYGGGNYSTTSYGAQGGANGGGFMAGSQNSPSGGSKFANESLRPVTIKQLHDAEEMQGNDDYYKLDGSTFSQVMLIGQIRNISSQATNVTYKLDDGTGTIEVKKWVTQDGTDPIQDKSVAQISQDMYVKVWGKLKIFNSKRHVGANVLRPITDYNEIPYHLLEATAVHLHFSRGPLTAGGGKDGQMNGHHNHQSDTSMGNTLGPAGDSGLAGVSPAARKVYNAIKDTPQSNEGLHMHDIATRLNMEINEVGKAGDELLSAGWIYTTVDDNTWAILNAGF